MTILQSPETLSQLSLTFRTRFQRSSNITTKLGPFHGTLTPFTTILLPQVGALGLP